MLTQLLIVVGYKVSAQSISPIWDGQAVFFLGCLTLEDGNDRPYQNTGKQLPTNIAIHLRRTKASTTLQLEPQISQKS